MNMIVLFKSEIIKEERKRKKRERDSPGDCLVSWLNRHLSGRCTVLRKPEGFVLFFSMVLIFTLSLAVHFLFTSLPSALVYTIWQLYFSCSLPALIIYIVHAQLLQIRSVWKVHWDECDFLLSALHLHMGAGRSFPCPCFFVLIRGANSERLRTVGQLLRDYKRLSHTTGQIVLWIRIAVLCTKT